jgi:N-acetylglucosaminyl-diphospho-decaprenol L-rhamnosyltransferase
LNSSTRTHADTPSTEALSVVYVSWRDTDMVVRSLERLAISTGIYDDPIELVVVVNEAADDDIRRLRSVWPGAKVIANRNNHGFGPACNQGAKAITGDIVFFVNPDTFAEPEAIVSIRGAMAANPGAVGLAPRLLDLGGTEDDNQRLFQLRRFPSLSSDARELLLIDLLLPRNPWHRRARYLDADREQPFAVEQAAAAALAVRREAFEAIGGFDERFWPAYWEDVDLCRRLASRGSILYWPRARLEHAGGVSASELGREAFLRTYYQNALRYRAKHYSLPARVGYRLLLGWGMAARALAALLGRRPGARKSIRGYLAVAAMATRASQ